MRLKDKFKTSIDKDDLEKIKEKFGLSNMRLSKPEIHIYLSGGHFLHHTDTSHSEKQIGTLIFYYFTPHSKGGSLYLNGKKVIGSSEDPQCYFIPLGVE